MPEPERELLEKLERLTPELDERLLPPKLEDEPENEDARR